LLAAGLLAYGNRKYCRERMLLYYAAGMKRVYGMPWTTGLGLEVIPVFYAKKREEQAGFPAY